MTRVSRILDHAATIARPATDAWRTRATVWGVLLALALVAVALAGIPESGVSVWVSIGVLVTTLQILVLLHVVGFHQIMLVTGIVNSIAIASAALFPSIADKADVAAELPVSEVALVVGIKAALLLTTGLFVGTLVVGSSRRVSKVPFEWPDLQLSPRVLASVGLLPLFLGYVGLGGAFWEGSGYGAVYGPPAALTVGRSLAPLGEMALGLLAFQKRPGYRVLAWAGLISWSLLHFASATRQLALVPGVLLVAAGLSSRARVSTFRVVATVLTTILAASLALELRSQATVGIKPFFTAILSGRLQVFDLAGAAGNVLFSGPLTYASSIKPSPLSSSTFLLSLNPLPGKWTEWSRVSPYLRINYATPFNGIGELYGLGTPYLVGYGIFVGVLVSIALRASEGATRLGRGIALIVATGILILFAITISQYNLRSATRLIYYLVVFCLGLRLLVIGRTQIRD